MQEASQNTEYRIQKKFIAYNTSKIKLQLQTYIYEKE